MSFARAARWSVANAPVAKRQLVELLRLGFQFGGIALAVALHAAWTVTCFAALMVAAFVIRLERYAGDIACDLAAGWHTYRCEPQLAVLDAMAACNRLSHWGLIQVATCLLARSTWIDDWASAPHRLEPLTEVADGPLRRPSVADGPLLRNAIIHPTSHQTRAAAVMYRLCDVPTLADLREVLEASGLDPASNAVVLPIAVQVRHFGSLIVRTATTSIVIDIRGERYSRDGQEWERIALGSLDLGELVGDMGANAFAPDPARQEYAPLEPVVEQTEDAAEN